MTRPPPSSTLFPYTTLFRSLDLNARLGQGRTDRSMSPRQGSTGAHDRSEEHTSELQSRQYLVCRLLLEKKKGLGADESRAPGQKPGQPFQRRARLQQ